MRRLLIAAPLLALAACGMNGTDAKKDGQGGSASAAQASATAQQDPAFASFEPSNTPDSQPRPEMQVQVVLDQLGFGPGIIDGTLGQSTVNALKGFQQANGLEETGKLDDRTRMALAQWNNVPATRMIRIPTSWSQNQYVAVPKKPEDQAKLAHLGYQNLDEQLAERFHTTPEVLHQLNSAAQTSGSPEGQATAPAPTPSPTGTTTPEAATFRPGQMVLVPNVALDAPTAAANGNDADWQRTLASLGVSGEQPQAAQIVVDKSESVLRAYNDAGKLIALFTVTSGSSHDPLPIGNWKIYGVTKNPPFHYNPDLFWDAKASDEKQTLKPGPNNPVGVVWIDLSKEHYGIHGTPEPQTIGRTQSHGCVRLTNWDAARLAGMVSTKTKVIFQA